MRCIPKAVLLQQVEACRANEISLNRMNFWIKTFGHEVVPPEAEDIKNSTTTNKNTEENITNDIKGESNEEIDRGNEESSKCN